MWKYYVEFNFAYAESELTMTSFINSALYLATRLSFPLIPFLGTLMYSKNKLLWFNASGFFVSLVMASMSGRNYSHYAMVLIPFMTVPCSVWFEANKISFSISAFVRDKFPIIATTVIILLILVCMIFFPHQFETPEVARYIAENTTHQAQRHFCHIRTGENHRCHRKATLYNNIRRERKCWSCYRLYYFR